MMASNIEQTSKEGPEASSCDTEKHKHQPAPLRGFFMMFLHYLGRKVMFLPMGLVLCTYVSFLFLLPMWPDFPKTYLTVSDIFNEYFIKPGWWWTMSVVFPLTLLTSYVNCCGHWLRILKHVSRLGVVTSSWYTWTRILKQIENNYGECIFSRVLRISMNETKVNCLAKGYNWQGFAISLNTFTLIYSSLVLIKETRVLIGWEVIDKLIKEEDKYRNNRYEHLRKTRPLHELTSEDFTRLKESYSKLTPFMQVMFLAATCLTLLWAYLLVSTLVNIHIMPENIIGGVLAISMWHFTYHWVYPLPWSIPLMPEDGLFIYQDVKIKS